MQPPWWTLARSAGALLFLLLLAATPALAGGGPTTTLVVVNEDSPTSLYVGTQYCALREIPLSHVCRLRDIPSRRVITIEQFRKQIWNPIAAYLKAHDLESSIDCIAYSTGFPFGVNFDGDFDEPRKKGDPVPRIASLNSMTFLARRVEEKDKNYRGGAVNKYCRTQSDTVYPSWGFRSAWEWARESKTPNVAPDLDAEPLDRYWLSTLLGFSGLQGNTTSEILSYLRAGRECDGTKPDGTVYLMEHKDVRARTRMPMFKYAIEELTKRKRDVAIVKQDVDGEDGRIPKARSDILGLVAGIATFDWSKYQSQMVPGAIAEHLTSFGGRLDGSGQTKLTSFLRAGAVGSSGTVAEPLALAWKFPTPFLHAHYADGCSLAEAFYQSVSGPYQLLIVGDPLARPFASFIEVMPVSAPKEPVKGTWVFGVETGPAIQEATDGAGSIEAFVNGRLVASAKIDEELEVDTGRLDDGHHVLQVVAVARGPVRTRSRGKPVAFRVSNAGRTVSIKKPRKVRLDQEIKLSGRCPGKPSTIEVLHGATPLATVSPKGSGWKASIPATRLGRGTHYLVARAVFGEGPAARSAAATVQVDPPLSPDGKKSRRKPKRKPKKKDKPAGGGRAGLNASVTDDKGKTHDFPITVLGRQGKQRFVSQLRAKAKGKLSRIVLTGEMHVPSDGMYTLAFNATGDVTIKLHDKEVFTQRDLSFDKLRFAEVYLLAGWHPIEIDYGVKSNGDFAMELGGDQVTQVLGGKALRH